MWIESMHNLHCPTCDVRLVERVGRHDVLDRPDPVYVGTQNSSLCPVGHQLPDDDELYAYRDRVGHPSEAPISEVPRPPGGRP